SNLHNNKALVFETKHRISSCNIFSEASWRRDRFWLRSLAVDIWSILGDPNFCDLPWGIAPLYTLSEGLVESYASLIGLMLFLPIIIRDTTLDIDGVSGPYNKRG
ncbi:hypothetical protein ACJX0J_013503, partial [Zea mays]